MLHIDTHAAYKELVKSGAQEKLAESIIRLVDNSRTAELENLVTKKDLEYQINLVRSEFKSEINDLKSDINSNFKIVFIIGGLVSAILVIPVLSSWLRPIIDRLTH